jgi:branched-chain amino acid transport system ATP-binding protein
VSTDPPDDRVDDGVGDAIGGDPVGGALLDARGVTVRFSGIRALQAVDLRVAPAELAGLIGPNGAGKTTFFNCLTGLLRPDSGIVRFAGRDVSRAPAHLRARLGMARTFQRIELFGGLSVRDHLIVAARARRVRGGVLRDLARRSAPTDEEQSRCAETLALLGLDDVADQPIESLSLGRGRLVELGRALMAEPRLLFLDEPSSGLDANETADIGRVLQTVNEQRGTAILLVEHDLELVRQVTRRLVCLDLGAVIADGPTTDVLADPAVRRAYVGDLEEGAA